MTIHFGTKYRTLGKSWKNIPYEVVRGFYFVCFDKNHNIHQYWMGETFEEAFKVFDDMGNKYLGDFNKYEYEIEFCSGYDVHGKLSWSNMNYANEFIDHGTY